MTDPRLLVPLHLLPPVSGAPIAYLCTECGDGLSEPACLDCKHHRLYNGAPVPCLDLSPPDGVPVRLDALGWALLVISRWYGCRLDDIYELRAMTDGVWQVRDLGRYTTVLRSTDPGYEDYDHDDLDQPRRIVAAILRKGRPGVAS
jgi:hypothetical protein